MKLKTRLNYICGADMGYGNKCNDGLRCPHCYDKFVAWCEIELMIKALKRITEAQYNADAKQIANETLDRLRKQGQI